MKNKAYFTVLLISLLTLSACSNGTKNSATKTQLPSSSSSEPAESVTYSDINSIPSGTDLLDTTNSILTQIGIPNINGFIDYDLTDDGTSQMIDAIILVNDCKLNVSAVRLTFPNEGDWTIMNISEYQSEPIKYYYAMESLLDHIDVYDFNTGEIVSSKKSDFNTDDILNEYNEKSDEIMNDFNNALDELEDEYNSSKENP